MTTGSSTCTFGQSWSSTYERTTITLTQVSDPNRDTRYSASAGYQKGKKYYGLFDPDRTYKYDNAKHYFYTQTGWNTVDPGNVRDANGNLLTIRAACLDGGTCDKFSGNWLNWLTMRRIDVAKKVLTGGRLGGDELDYVLIGSPIDSGYGQWKVFNDSGADAVYYTPFKTPMGVYSYSRVDKEQRTGNNGKYVPLLTFFKATSYTDSSHYATALGPLVTLSLDSSYGNPGESKLVDGVDKRSYDGSYYLAVKVGTVAANEPPAGVVQNMASKVRLGFMQFNYGIGPADSTYNDLGEERSTYDIDGDGTTDLRLRYADGGRVVNRVGDASRVNSWQKRADGNYVTIYSIVKNINETLWETYTPISEVMREAMRYFKQVPPAYAWVDTAGTVQPDYLVNNDWDPYYYAELGAKQDCAKSYIILVSDGEENNTHPNYNSCQTFGCTSRTAAPTDEYNGGSFRFRIDGTYMDDIAYIMYTTDLRDDINGKQNISLYTVLAFDEGGTAKRYMQTAALAGGFVDLNNDGQPGKSGNLNNNWWESYNWPNYDGMYEWDVGKDGSPDHFFAAADGYLLESYIQSIFNQIALGGGAGAVATISQDTKQADIIVRGAFDAVDPLDRTRYVWNGHLDVYWPNDTGKYEFELPGNNAQQFCRDIAVGHCPDAPKGKCCWDAGEEMANFTTTTTRPKVYSYVNGSQLLLNQTNAAQFTGLMRQKVEAPKVPSDGEVSTDQAAAIIQWLRGNVDDEGYPLSDAGTRIPDGCTGTGCVGPYRNRKDSKLGDIVYSTPVVVGPPPLGGVSAADPDVKSFYQFRTDNLYRDRVAFVGANDGMIHAYLLARWETNAITGESKWNYLCQGSGSDPACGQEIWSYAPSNLLSEIFQIAGVDYGRTDAGRCRHRSMVDLSPKAWDVYIASPDCPDNCCTTKRCWRTVIIGGERGGGDVYCAIDVTDPMNPRILWEHSVLKNLAVVYDQSGQKMSLPFRERDIDGDTYEDVYFNLKTIPMSWSEPIIGRVRIPHQGESNGVSFYRYTPDASGIPVLSARGFTRTTCTESGTTLDCGDYKRQIAFIGGGFRHYEPLNLGVAPNPDIDTVKKALLKPHLLALDIETGENLFQAAWALLVKARSDAGKLPDLKMPSDSTTQFIPRCLGDLAGLDVWANNDGYDDLGRFAEDGYMDRIYVGDLHGFMYRMVFNLKTFQDTSKNPTNWGLNVNFWPVKPLRSSITTVNSCDDQNVYRGCRQPIAVAPTVVLDGKSVSTSAPALRVLFGTGKLDDSPGDNGDMARMSFYNLLDRIKLFQTTLNSVTTDTALPGISASGSYTLTPAVTAGNPDTVTTVGTGQSNGFTITGTHFGITHGDGVCYSESSSDTSKDLIWAGLDCSEGHREKCCNWVNTAEQPDCCEQLTLSNHDVGQRSCPNCTSNPSSCQTIDGTANKITPCWGCIFDFENRGERVLGKAVTAGGYTFFSTFTPSDNACAMGGTARLYILDYRCKAFPDNFNPLIGQSGLLVTNLMTNESTPHQFGVVIDLGTGMPSRPVLDSRGESVLIQKSDGGFVRIPAPKYLVSPIQFKGGWSEK